MVKCQRYLHFYAVNELINTLLVVYLFHRVLTTTYTIWEAFVYYVVTYTICFALLCLLLTVRRRYRPSFSKLHTGKPRFPNMSPRSFRLKSVTARDGIVLQVRVTGHRQQTTKKVMIFAPGLGCSGSESLIPIMGHFGDEYTYITWNYRGFFGSSNTSLDKCRRFLSIAEHARDCRDILHACGYQKADVIVGHSMGAPVAFEFALLFPDQVEKLIVMNGMHGHVYSTAAQPLVRFPFAADMLSVVVEGMMSRPTLMRQMRLVLLTIFRFVLPFYSWIWQSPLLVDVLGDEYLLRFLEKYLRDVVSTDENALNWLRCLHELNAYSCHHVLPEITQPTLIISGFFDLMTPAMQGVEIARRIKNSSHYCDPFSSHASILESPEWCVAEVIYFLETNKTKKEKKEKTAVKRQ